MNLTFSYSLWWLLLIVPIALAATWWMYLGTRDMLGRGTQILLSAFRFLVLTILGLLLLEPLLTTLTKLTFSPIIAVLQDDSESLVIQPDSSFVREEYPRLLQSFLDEFEGENYQVDGYSFADVIAPDLNPDSLAFDQTGTNISEGLSYVEDLYQNQNLGAIVLISDGIPTVGVNPLYKVEGIQQPIYTVLLGDTTRQRDIRIQEVLYNEIAYLNSEMPIRVKVRNIGYGQAPLRVTLRNKDKVFATESLTLSANQTEGTVDFYLQPKEVGLQAYQVIVSRLDGEITYRNNYQTIYINVLETRVRIALFAGGPHPDLGALSQAFEREDSYEVTEFVLRSPGVFYDAPSNYNLEDFDLFILHNYPQSQRDEDMVGRISQLIKEERKPVMYLTGISTDLPTLSPLFDYMAITPKGFSPKSEEVIADFKPDYRDHSTYTFGDQWINWANNAPPFYRNQSDWQAKATADVYATARIKNVRLDYPVFALQNQLGRKNMVLLGENFWRWRAHSYLESDDFELFDEWLFNLIKWLRTNDDNRKFIVEPTERFFTGDVPVVFRGQAYDDSYNPIAEVDIKLTLTDPDGRQEDYYLNETRSAQYFLELYNLAEGSYSYIAEGRKNDRLIGRDRGEFSIGRSNIEHFQLQADRNLMEQIALRSGGEALYAEDLPALAQQLKDLPGLKPTSEFKQNRKSFHEYWWIMVLLLTLLSAEWIIRKVNSMV